MKRFLIFFLLLPAFGHAQGYTQQAAQACAGTAWVAENVITRRMAGEPKENLLRDMQSQSSQNNRERGAYMVDAAYSIPPMQGDARRIVIQGFKDSYYVDCLNEVSGIK